VSTILEALRKLQSDRERSPLTKDLRDSIMGEVSKSPRRRRKLPWLLAGSFGLLAVALAALLYLPEERVPDVPVLSRAAPREPESKPRPTAPPSRPALRERTAPPRTPQTKPLARAQQRAAPRAAKPDPPAVGATLSKPAQPKPEEQLVSVPRMPARPTPRFGQITRADPNPVSPESPLTSAETSPKPEIRPEAQVAKTTTTETVAPPVARVKAAPSRTPAASLKSAPEPDARVKASPAQGAAKKPPTPAKPSAGAKAASPSPKPPAEVVAQAAEPTKPEPPRAKTNPFLEPFKPLTKVKQLIRRKAKEGAPESATLSNTTTPPPEKARPGNGESMMHELPPGFPELSLESVRWHPDPSRCVATLRVDEISGFRVQEGDVVQGALIYRIDPGAVELQVGSARRRLHVTP
jgi:hypothetical protein